MSDYIEERSVPRVRTLLVPITMIAGGIVAGIVLISDLNSDPARYAAFDPDAFENIEFLALADQPQAAELQDVLTRACEMNGCDADALHPMILASAAGMTPGELEEALAAQVRVEAESMAIRDRALPASGEARMAEMEILAAEQISALYEAELAER